MKKLILIAALSFIAFASKAQTQTPVTDSTIYNSVQEPPVYPGGMSNFARYLGASIRYPMYSREHNIQGRVIIQFIVEKDGRLSNIHILRSVSPDIDQEAMRVMQGCPNWVPGTQSGKPVRVKFTIPLNFQLQVTKTPRPYSQG